ncbi:MAG: roadblock/LC7 domain-containing protein [Candidatus Lokiarchaeota archaeon]
MLLKDKIGIHLDQIKQIRGIENAVLTQRDGNPIQSTGVWFSKDEIFNVCAATSAIYNVGIYLYPDNLKYILIEGKKAKILIAPLNNPLHHSLNKILEEQGIIDDNQEFYIAITAQPNVNLGGIFLQTNECLRKIKTSLITSGESFKPPLIEFNKRKLKEIIQNFNIKEFEEDDYRLSSYSLSFSKDLSLRLKNILFDLSKTIKNLEYAFIMVKGGFIASKHINNNKLDQK